MSLGRAVRQTLTIARRDFTATVFTPAFLIFLLVPFIMFSLGPLIGLSANGMVRNGMQNQRIVVIAPAAQMPTIQAVDKFMRELTPSGQNGPPALRIDVPQADVAAQARALLKARNVDASAVLYGPLDRPTVLYAAGRAGPGRYLAHLAEQVLRAERSGGPARLSHPTMTEIATKTVSGSGTAQVAFFATLALFMLNVMLSGQAVGTMAEERGNKVIEIIAAAIPLECVFLGKLIAMLGSALLFLLFWGTIFGNIAKLIPAGLAAILAQLGAATGPTFPLLFFGYFILSYLLLGAVFLTVGAQAATPREIQLYSLPITIFMVLMFGFSLVAAGQPGSGLELAAQIFPFSSPFAMTALAARSPELWPHVFALAWQLLWVVLTIAFGARWFRRGVLQSGGPSFRLRRKPAA